MERVRFVSIPDNEIIEEKRKKIDNYETSLQVIQAFISLITWDDNKNEIYENSFNSIGRRMTPLERIIVGGDDITPDIVIQKDDIGYSVEVKKSIPKNNNYWNEIIEQIKKYSSPLIGWWTDNERIIEQCSVLLLDISYSYEFKDYLEKNQITFDNCFSIIEFAKHNGINEFIFLRKYYGEIFDEDLNGFISHGHDMPIEKIVGSYGELKFYDSKPEVVEYIMSVLWQNLFNLKKVEEGVYSEKSSCWEFIVSVDEVTNELQKSYGRKSSNERDQSFPRTSWVKEALDNFVDIGFGERIDSKSYRIYFKKINGDVVNEFINRVYKYNKDSLDKEEQLLLFN